MGSAVHTAIMAAAPSSCASTSHPVQLFTWVGALVVVGGPVLVAWLSGRKPSRVGKRLRQLGWTLLVLGFLAYGISYPAYLASRHPDACGHTSSPWVVAALVGLVVGMLGVLVRNGSEWGAIACVACLDLGLAISLIGGVAAGKRTLGAAITILLVHGVCTFVATWWSWRARGADRSDIRARASEAGRTLAAAWIVLAVLGVSASMFGHDVPALAVPDSTAVGIFVVAAISVVMGSGYTKYAEAMQLLRPATNAVAAQSSPPTRPATGTHALAGVLLAMIVLARGATRAGRDQAASD